MGTVVIAPRVIPVLQIDDGGWLVKTRQYQSPRYLGDPINAVKIFNEKQVDELVVVDIAASRSHRDPAYEVLADIASMVQRENVTVPSSTRRRATPSGCRCSISGHGRDRPAGDPRPP
ncbi:hypothetical protein CTI14_43490, partial [Methylobacterium radiotolerans]